MDLNAEEVRRKFVYCLVRLTESTREAVRVDAVKLTDVCFDAQRLLEVRPDIKSMILDLPTGFRQYHGGGMAVSALKFNHNYEIWTQHTGVHDQLIALGIACGFMRFLTPRETWHLLPNRVPFVYIREDY